MIRPARSHLQLFDRLFERCRSFSPIPMAVASPLTDVALAGALDAAKQGLIEPILVGSEREIRSLADRIEANLGTATIIDAANDEDAAQKSVALCRKGQARALMKGCVHTDTLMHAVLQHDSGLRTLRRVSHAFVLDTEAYPRPMMITDAAINIVPSLDDKVDIVKNSIDLAHTIGVERPNVAILSAIETVTSKMVSTIDAAALCKMADRGQITGAVLDGPLAFDTAVNAEAASIKNLRSPVAGVADVLIVPDLEAGNMLVKELEYLGGAELAGLVLGGRVPIVLTSRADDRRARTASCALALLYLQILDHE